VAANIVVGQAQSLRALPNRFGDLKGRWRDEVAFLHLDDIVKLTAAPQSEAPFGGDVVHAGAVSEDLWRTYNLDRQLLIAALVPNLAQNSCFCGDLSVVVTILKSTTTTLIGVLADRRHFRPTAGRGQNSVTKFFRAHAFSYSLQISIKLKYSMTSL